jgi:hypothetical protein
VELRADGLASSITFTPPDEEGWMWCHTIIEVPGFRGDFHFQMLRADLNPFRAQLVHALDETNWPCEVRLTSTEPGVDLSFRVERTGRIAGTNQFGGDARPSPSGSFAMDQTYLSPLLAQIDRLLSDPPQTPADGRSS